MPILHAKPPHQDPGKQRDDENCRKADRSETCQGQVRSAVERCREAGPLIGTTLAATVVAGHHR
jgi:hypothetical protein